MAAERVHWPVKLAHVVMRTRRLREMIAWYEAVLAAKTVFSDGNVAFLTYDDEHHRIAFVRLPGLLPRPRFMAGVEHVAFTYAGLGELLATWRRLRGAGIAPYWCINHGATTSLYYADPDGNQVELQVDNFEKREDLDAFLSSGAFRTNPIGVDFDPEAYAARYDAGEPPTEIVRWTEVTPRGFDTIPVAHVGRLHGFLARLAGRRARRR